MPATASQPLIRAVSSAKRPVIKTRSRSFLVTSVTVFFRPNDRSHGGVPPKGRKLCSSAFVQPTRTGPVRQQRSGAACVGRVGSPKDQVR